jgi:hypothetical protein
MQQAGSSGNPNLHHIWRVACFPSHKKRAAHAGPHLPGWLRAPDNCPTPEEPPVDSSRSTMSRSLCPPTLPTYVAGEGIVLPSPSRVPHSCHPPPESSPTLQPRPPGSPLPYTDRDAPSACLSAPSCGPRAHPYTRTSPTKYQPTPNSQLHAVMPTIRHYTPNSPGFRRKPCTRRPCCPQGRTLVPAQRSPAALRSVCPHPPATTLAPTPCVRDAAKVSTASVGVSGSAAVSP